MNNLVANIAKGVIGKFQKKRKISDYDSISWFKEKLLKHQDDVNVKQIEFKHFKLFYKRPYEVLHTYKEIFENEIYRFASDSNIPVIIDCGANIGLSVIYFKLLYPDSTVIAFEPDNNNFELLKKNIDSNNFGNVELYKKAVWIKDGTISFEASESEASRINEEKADDAALVKCIKLVSFLSRYQKIDFLKMDIEGAEDKVIDDCSDVLSNIQNMFIEYHGKTTETEKLTKMLSLFEEKGFRVYIKNAADELKHPFIEKETPYQYDVQLNIFCYKKDNL
jgi:FkbM family methyltransferase